MHLTSLCAAAIKLLRIAKSIDKRCWWFNSPLRQFTGEFPDNVFKALESRGYGTYDMTLSLLEMDAKEVGGLAHFQKGAKSIIKHVKYFPHLEISCVVQPVTRAVLKFSVTLVGNFDWNAGWLGSAQGFWLWIEDGVNERIYHQEHVLLSRRNHGSPVELELMIPAFEPLPPQYYVRVISDTWVGVESLLPVR